MAAGAAIVLIVVVAILVAIVRRRRRALALEAPLPLIPFASSRGGSGPPRPNATFRTIGAPFDLTSAPTPARAPSVAQDAVAAVDRSPYAPPPVSTPGARSPNASATPSTQNPLASTALPNDMVEGAAVDGALVRYWRPADGTLQFLPGRLEVIAGRDAGQEIRFVRTPGPDGTRVTFGRAEGAPYRHVQLREPTVSRAHARMTLDLGGVGEDRDSRSGGTGWRLENLSATNPVVVNGRPLATDAGDGSMVVLREGDRIEMGEVVFRFHSK